ncbi:hypothetical protein ACFP81_01105 [Deinococcus lacus]|uniref:Lipoprotein n=1 Tax=Deinococcus lacus TaxID=392561 RepID=A0ABW1Y9A2_9DEIO
MLLRRAPLALALLLAGCSRTADTFQPRIVVTSPDGSGMTSARDLNIKGYVMDDTGAVRLTINGEAVPLDSGSAKIRYFTYQPGSDALKGEGKTFAFAARDAAGNESNLKLSLNVDAKLPQIKVTGFERIGKTIRVSGVATDNDRIEEILVDGTRLNITSGPKVSFYAETQGIWADLEAIDRAGNVTKLRAE